MDSPYRYSLFEDQEILGSPFHYREGPLFVADTYEFSQAPSLPSSSSAPRRLPNSSFSLPPHPYPYPDLSLIDTQEPTILAPYFTSTTPSSISTPTYLPNNDNGRISTPTTTTISPHDLHILPYSTASSLSTFSFNHTTTPQPPVFLLPLESITGQQEDDVEGDVKDNEDSDEDDEEDAEDLTDLESIDEGDVEDGEGEDEDEEVECGDILLPCDTTPQTQLLPLPLPLPVPPSPSPSPSPSTPSIPLPPSPSPPLSTPPTPLSSLPITNIKSEDSFSDSIAFRRTRRKCVKAPVVDQDIEVDDEEVTEVNSSFKKLADVDVDFGVDGGSEGESELEFELVGEGEGEGESEVEEDEGSSKRSVRKEVSQGDKKRKRDIREKEKSKDKEVRDIKEKKKLKKNGKEGPYPGRRDPDKRRKDNRGTQEKSRNKKTAYNKMLKDEFDYICEMAQKSECNCPPETECVCPLRSAILARMKAVENWKFVYVPKKKE